MVAAVVLPAGGPGGVVKTAGNTSVVVPGSLAAFVVSPGRRIEENGVCCSDGGEDDVDGRDSPGGARRDTDANSAALPPAATAATPNVSSPISGGVPVGMAANRVSGFGTDAHEPEDCGAAYEGFGFHPADDVKKLACSCSGSLEKDKGVRKRGVDDDDAGPTAATPQSPYCPGVPKFRAASRCGE
jgi:hypothetical protein